ncbi:MAG: transporter [Pseudomonadota bacterium]
MNRKFGILLASTAFFAISLVGSVSYAADKATFSNKDIDSLVKLVEDQRKRLDAQQRKLDTLERLVGKMSKSNPASAKAATQVAKNTSATPASNSSTGDVGGDNANKSDETKHANTGVPNEVGTERKPEESDKPPEIAADLNQGGVLLQKGKAIVTPSFEYSRSSATLVSIEGFSVIPAINIGTFQVSRVGRDVLTGSISGRLGITNRLELEGKIPYLYRRDATTGRPVGGASSSDSTTRLSSNGIGDVEVGAHYQINDGKKGWPFFISNLRFKSATGEGPFEIPTDTNGLLTRLPTGSGFYAIQPSVTAIFPSDPVVYYANLGYLHNVPRSFNGVKVEPGGSISAAFGMSMSLNDRASFSVGYSHSTVFETIANNVSLNSDLLQVGSLDLGYAYQLNDRLGLNFNASFGVTEDAPDARLGFRVPIKFDVY